MLLNEFEQQIDPKILKRGQDYFDEGAVCDLWRPETNRYCAVVDGGEPYDVAITLAAGMVESVVCDCPYDWGPYCKHEVAVLLAIRGHLQSGQLWPVAQTCDKYGLRRLLARLTKDELLDMCLEFAKDYDLRVEMRCYVEDGEYA